jgi:ankyrin repeat protein
MTDEWREPYPLHVAVQGSTREQVEQLLAEGHGLDVFDEAGNTPLRYAALAGNLPMLRLLLAAGADVNAHHVASIGDTPLRAIASHCTYEVAQLLVEAGADPTIPGFMGITALHRAQERKRGDGPRVATLLEQAARNPGRLQPRRRK